MISLGELQPSVAPWTEMQGDSTEGASVAAAPTASLAEALPYDGIFGDDGPPFNLNLTHLMRTTNFSDSEIMTIENLSRLYSERFQQEDNVKNLLTIAAYSVIFFISLFGNLMVCHIIITNRKLHTFTNCFIANLSVSDLLMTLVNVPFGTARLLLENWPFGSFFCKCLPFIQTTSVYVSTITMCIISIDRYCVVVHPLGPRITNVVPLVFVLGVIWLVSCLLSIPFAMYNEVTEFGFLNRKMVRCRVNYPEPEEFYRQAFTLLAFLTQYLLPLTIASIAYTFIALSMKKRSKLGAMTKEQIGRILKTNRQTITMLVLVLIVQAVVWLPLHCFYLYMDFINITVHHTPFYSFCYWLAMSSICYNPFIYSARNKHFRKGMKNFFRYLIFKGRTSEANINRTESTSLPQSLARVPSIGPRYGESVLNRFPSPSRSLCQWVPPADLHSSPSSSLEEPTLHSLITMINNGTSMQRHTILLSSQPASHNGGYAPMNGLLIGKMPVSPPSLPQLIGSTEPNGTFQLKAVVGNFIANRNKSSDNKYDKLDVSSGPLHVCKVHSSPQLAATLEGNGSISSAPMEGFSIPLTNSCTNVSLLSRPEHGAVACGGIRKKCDTISNAMGAVELATVATSTSATPAAVATAANLISNDNNYEESPV